MEMGSKFFDPFLLSQKLKWTTLVHLSHQELSNDIKLA